MPVLYKVTATGVETPSFAIALKIYPWLDDAEAACSLKTLRWNTQQDNNNLVEIPLHISLQNENTLTWAISAVGWQFVTGRAYASEATFHIDTLAIGTDSGLATFINVWKSIVNT